MLRQALLKYKLEGNREQRADRTVMSWVWGSREVLLGELACMYMYVHIYVGMCAFTCVRAWGGGERGWAVERIA